MAADSSVLKKARRDIIISNKFTIVIVDNIVLYNNGLYIKCICALHNIYLYLCVT